MKTTFLLLACAIAALAVPVAADAPVSIIGPAPYLSLSASPFSHTAFAWFHLEDFEGYKTHTPGVSYAGTGIALANRGDENDSVDADDGVIDGFGRAGAALLADGDPGVTITFDRAALGDWPTHAGVVWTDGSNPVSFEAFDGLGNPLGGIVNTRIADSSRLGETDEDRFFGVESASGIAWLHIWSDSGGQIEIDHVQYGRAADKRVVGISNAATRQPITAVARENFVFVLWGEVKSEDFGPNGFTIDDGAGAPVRVSATSHTVAVGNCVRVKGTLDTMQSLPVLTCAAGDVSVLRQ